MSTSRKNLDKRVREALAIEAASAQEVGTLRLPLGGRS